MSLFSTLSIHSLKFTLFFPSSWSPTFSRLQPINRFKPDPHYRWLKSDIFKHDELISFNVFCLHWVRESWFLLVSWVVGFAPLPLKVMKGWNEWWLGYWVLLHQLLLVLHMFRRLRWFVGLNQKNWSTKRLVNVEQPGPARPNQLPVLDAVHEVAIYIHRFHNLDLFEQG